MKRLQLTFRVHFSEMGVLNDLIESYRCNIHLSEWNTYNRENIDYTLDFNSNEVLIDFLNKYKHIQDENNKNKSTLHSK